MNDTPQPIVSICCITYNHEKFIAEAINGFLAQKLLFNIEIIIADDASNDRTPQIITDFQLAHPGRIKAFLHKQNKGMMDNLNFVLRMCQGKYIALCEGDDYWTDPHKLQKQVEYLEGHPECALCHHPVQILKDGILSKKKVVGRKIGDFKVYSIEKLTDKNFIYTSSVVFKREVLDILPPWFSQLAVGDYPLFLFAGKMGNYCQLNEYMSVYRIQGGIWSGQTKVQKAQTMVRLISQLHKGFADMPEIQARLLHYFLKQAEIVKQSGSNAAEDFIEEAFPAFAAVFPFIMDEYIELKGSAATPPSYQQLKKGFKEWFKWKLFS